MENNIIKSGVLYIVATPIGNLQDITYRAINILTNAEIILAEDTRVTSKLLSQLGIRNNQKLISCHDYNEINRLQLVEDFLNEDKKVALVSDAGTPLISDPGYKIVNYIRSLNMQVIPIPGVSAVISALSVAGLPSNNFYFKGFLSVKKTKRQQELTDLEKFNTTIILYESVHRLEYLLDDIIEILPNIQIFVAKEITKQFENFIYGKATQVKEFFEENKSTLKGEFVVILDCNKSIKEENNQNSTTNIDAGTLLKELLQYLSLKDTVKITTNITGLKKKEIYNRALEIKNL